MSTFFYSKIYKLLIINILILATVVKIIRILVINFLKKPVYNHLMVKSDKSAVKKLLVAMIPYSRNYNVVVAHPHKFVTKLSQDLDTPSKNISNYLYRAKERGYLVERDEDNHKRTYTFTAKGRILILNSLAKKTSKKWDKKWRFIIFDIPENQRRNRDIFRSKLKELGFVPRQRSVWISPYDYKNDIDFLIKELKISDYVNFIVGKPIYREDKLKEIFKLD